MTKYTRVRDFPLLESALFVLMSYSTFLIAEASDLTGTLTEFFFLFKNTNLLICRSGVRFVLWHLPSALHIQQPV